MTHPQQSTEATSLYEIKENFLEIRRAMYNLWV